MGLAEREHLSARGIWKELASFRVSLRHQRGCCSKEKKLRHGVGVGAQRGSGVTVMPHFVTARLELEKEKGVGTVVQYILQGASRKTLLTFVF